MIKEYPLCPINCSGGCPVCAPDEHTGKNVMDFLFKYSLLRQRPKKES